jgi:hypothetical protein
MRKDIHLDKAKYEAVQTYLKTAFEHMLAAGRSVRDFTEFARGKFGDSFQPYLDNFLADVGEGRVKVEGMTKAAKTALLGTEVSPQGREERIRVAAFVRAEQRGFSDGSPEQDWLAAEHEIDEQLAAEAGLFTKGHKVLASATAIIEKELGSIKEAIATWLEGAGDLKEAAKKKATKKEPREMAT